jgi:hypothetical protein
MDEMDKIIQRAQKLKKMADSALAVGSLAEAEAFMEGLNKTLAFHNLDASVLTLDLKDKYDPMVRMGVPSTAETYKRGTEQWARDLTSAVAQAHFCAYLVGAAGNYVYFYGRKSNVETAVKIFVYLRDMALRLGTAAYLKEEQRLHKVNGTAAGAAQYKWNWFQGFSSEVASRYKAMRARVESDSGMALVLVGVRKEAAEYASRHAGRGHVSLGRRAAQRVNRANEDGREAARNTNLRPHTLDADTIKEPKKLR